MRFVCYDGGEGPRAGVLRDDRIVDVGPGGVDTVLRNGGLPDAVAETGPVVARDEVELLAPVLAPSKIVCMGLNYRDHAAEAGLEAPETSTFFAKFANALAPPGSEV